MNNSESSTKVQEIWKDIPNYDGLYQVSSLGRIKSLNRIVCHSIYGDMNIKEKYLKPSKNNNGYLGVTLHNNGHRKSYFVHQLVAIAFLNYKSNTHKLVIDHKNFDRQDNRLKNLQIISQRENTNKKHLNSSSKYVGVYYRKKHKSWESSIRINGRKLYLGTFKNEYEAHIAYQNKLREID